MATTDGAVASKVLHFTTSEIALQRSQSHNTGKFTIFDDGSNITSSSLSQDQLSVVIKASFFTSN
jgi:hypothetical protein